MGNLLVLLPVVVLIVAALTLVVLGFVLRRRPDVLWAFALGSLLLSLVLTVDMMGLSLTAALGLPLWDAPVRGSEGAFPDLKMAVDAFALFFHLVFLLVALLAVLGSRSYIRSEEPHQAEYYALMFLAVVGMMLVASATDLFVLFLAFEVASLSTFALVAFRKEDKRATEASLKFFIIGAVSSAIILFGISLLYGVSGAMAAGMDGFDASAGLLSFTVLPTTLAAGLAQFEPTLIVAVVLLLAGFGFKVAVVPFHMWAPDVYQGSPTTITVFLAAGSKKVGIIALFKVFLVGLLTIQIEWIVALAVLAIVTQTVGNVLAIPQRNLKRMLAYSSIAQAGYILIALVVGTLVVEPGTPGAADVAAAGLAGGLYHVLTHAIMTGGAFLVLAATAVLYVGEDIEDFRGLSKRMPFVAFAMAIFLLSLAGIPPLGGFFSKFVLFSSALNAATYNPWMLWLAVAGVLNSALSLYYYARVIRYMYILDPTDRRKLSTPAPLAAGIAIALVGIVAAGLFAQPLVTYMSDAARAFLGVG
jgi:NADH-quinone oxidoreductase subunit N